MLPAPWALRPDQPDGVRDMEAFCQEIVAATCRAQAIERIEPCDLAEALCHLLMQAVLLDDGYDEAKRAKPYLRFDLWLRTALRCDLLDFWRSPAGFGRHGQHRVPAVGEFGQQVLDDRARASGDDDGFGGLADDGARPDRLDPASLVDPADSLDARLWLDPDGDRGAAETSAVAGLRRRPGPAVAGGDRGAGARAGRSVGAVAAGAGRGAEPFRDCGRCGWRSFPQAPNGLDHWHFPERCVSCGGVLLEPAGRQAAARAGGLEETKAA